MKYIFKYLIAVVAVIAIFASCDKKDMVTTHLNGTAGVLTSSAATITPALADTNKAVVTFSWTNPLYANDSATTKYIVDIDSTTKNFANPISRTLIGTRSTPFTGRDINAILIAKGYKIGVPVTVDVRVISSYGNNNERYTSNVITLKVTPFADPSILATSSTSVTGTLATASTYSNTFSWSAAFVGYTAGVTYTLQYDSSTKNFVAPQEIAIGSAQVKTMTQGDMNTTALNSGIKGGNTGKVEYRIKAVTASGITVYSNVVNVTIQSYQPIVRMYLPGSYQTATGNGTDWTPGDAPELIRDQRSGVFNDMYWIYIYLPAGAQFKVSEGRAWDISYGPGSGAGTLSASSGGNLSVTTAGYYRITVNRTTLKYDIRAGRMGFVGGATGAGWNPPNVFPIYAMAAANTNLFIGVTTFSSGGWKLIDNDVWDGGTKLVDETRTYGTSGGDGSTLEIGGSNFNDFSTAGRYRVIWDGRDRDNVKYNYSPATEMRIVGNGLTGVADWDPPTSPTMTYSGQGIWTATVALKANLEFKFVAGNAWGAFDYEDNSGQSQALGTPRKIQWEGGNNFKTPAAAGTYTIVLNENTQTVTVN